LSDHLLLHTLAKSSSLDLSYKSLHKQGGGKLRLNDLRLTGKTSGLGISSEEAFVTPKLLHFGFKGVIFYFSLNRVRFLSNVKSGPDKFDDIASLVSLPFSKNWVYENISGNLEMSKRGLILKDIKAAGNDITLALNGIINSDNTADLDIKIGFSKSVYERIPKELSGLVLAGEEGQWKNLSVHLTGNFSKPSIQLSSKLFRLNIKEIEAD